MSKAIPALLVFLATATGALAAELSGKVIDARTGEPVVEARVQLLETLVAVQADARGSFALPFPAGRRATVLVSAPGYRVARLALAELPGAPLEVRLEVAVSFEDRIEVTATRAREGVDPVSFTNVPREKIAESYWAQDPSMLLTDVAPGYLAYSDNGNGIGYSYFSIRGFGQARARVTLNGAPLNDAESGELFFIDHADFLSTTGDIQIQRGVFGLSGIGGAVDLTTATPAVEPAFALEGGAGSFGTRRFSARWESGLIGDGWALAARYSKISSDGYRDQAWVEMSSYYLSLARFASHSSVRLVLFGGPEQTHLAYEGVPRSTLEGGLSGNAGRDRRYNPLTFPGEIDSFTQPHYQIIHDWSISTGTQLSQVFYLFEGDGYYEQLRSQRALVEYNLPDVVLPDGTVISHTDLVRRRTVDEWDAGWVPTFTHTSGAWTTTVKGEVRLHHAHHFGEVRWAQYYPQGIPPNWRYYDYQLDKRTAALQAVLSWQATRWLALSAGLELATNRYQLSRDRLKSADFAESYRFLLPRLGAIASLGDGVDLYLSVARGMHEPAFRTVYDPEDYYGTRVSLDPEDVWDLEAGLSWRRARWRARANAFYMRFANEIVYAGALDDNGVPIYGNGARSLHRGVELDATIEPVPHLALDAALTYSRNTFTRYREFGWDSSVARYDGNRIAGYPDLIATLTARTRVAGVALALTGRRVGCFYLDSSQDNRRNPERREAPGYVRLVNPAFTVLSLDARTPLPGALTKAVRLSKLELRLRADNLLDERYTAFGYVEEGVPLFMPAAGRSFFVGVSLGL